MSRGAFVIAVLLCSVQPTPAVEKHWVAHEAEIIVVGTLSPRLTVPWIDGWHLSGTIRVEQVLYGGQPVQNLEFDFVASEWNTHYEWWRPPLWHDRFLKRGVWFLQGIDGRRWRPSVGIGFDEFSQKAYWEEYIRREKR